MTAESPRRTCIAVIGDAGARPGSERYELAEALGLGIVDAGHRMVTGGLGGVMEAACKGARSSPSWTDGTTVGLLPGCDPADANPYVDIAIPTGLDHGRNQVVAQSDAVIAVGGGAGTLSEIAFAWVHRRLIIAMRCGGWSERLADERVDDRVRYPALPEDRAFGASSADEALALLGRYLGHYHRRHRRVRRRTDAQKE